MRHGVLVSTVLTAVSSGLAQSTPAVPKITTEVVDEVAIWLDGQERPVDDSSSRWPVDATADEPRFAPTLYSGTPGVVLFYLEHYRATGRERSLDLAKKGAAHLEQAVANGMSQTGLYTGIAGIGYVMIEMFRATGDRSYRGAAVACVRELQGRAKPVDDGVEWGPVTDVISGTAGVGLLLLYAAEQLDIQQPLELATQAGTRLLELGRDVGDGTTWLMNPASDRELPNFSHGTAGVAYFLSTLYAKTSDQKFLDAALRGGRYLTSITDENGLIRHNHDAPELYYLSWCHGPPGTARLFRRLNELTDDARWSDWVDGAATALASSGIPGEPHDGFWNNHSVCCGTAGVLDFLLNDDGDHSELTDELWKSLFAGSTVDATGRRWQGAEHRVRPEQLTTQTGYMQGAAGIGIFLLHELQRQRGEQPVIVLPDSTSPRGDWQR